MRRIMSILAVVGLVLGASIAVSAPADAAIRANDDLLFLQKIGGALRVSLNGKVLFKNVKFKGGAYKFAINANRFLANDVGKNKSMVAFDTQAKFLKSGINIKLRTNKNGEIKRIIFRFTPKAIAKKKTATVLSDYVLKANGNQFDAGTVALKVASPS